MLSQTVPMRKPSQHTSRIGPLNPIIRALGSLAPAEGERVGVRGLPGELRFMGRGRIGGGVEIRPRIVESPAAVRPAGMLAPTRDKGVTLCPRRPL
jgi:hypothetical protein